MKKSPGNSSELFCSHLDIRTANRYSPPMHADRQPKGRRGGLYSGVQGGGSMAEETIEHERLLDQCISRFHQCQIDDLPQLNSTPNSFVASCKVLLENRVEKADLSGFTYRRSPWGSQCMNVIR